MRTRASLPVMALRFPEPIRVMWEKRAQPTNSAKWSHPVAPHLSNRGFGFEHFGRHHVHVWYEQNGDMFGWRWNILISFNELPHRGWRQWINHLAGARAVWVEEQEVTRALRYVEHHLDLHSPAALQRSALWRLSGLHWMQLSEGERQGGGDHQVQLGGGDPGQARSSEEEALNNI